jgi:hypothetical protein
VLQAAKAVEQLQAHLHRAVHHYTAAQVVYMVYQTHLTVMVEHHMLPRPHHLKDVQVAAELPVTTV